METRNQKILRELNEKTDVVKGMSRDEQKVTLLLMAVAVVIGVVGWLILSWIF